MTCKVHTENSIYEVDEANSRIRRMQSNHAATPNQAENGEWQTYTDISLYGYCNSDLRTLFIVWGIDGNIVRQTMTSPITKTDGEHALTIKETIL